MPSDVWTITITPQTVWIALLGVMLLTLIALLLWSGLRRTNLIERLGREWLDLLYVVIGLFFVVALFATGAVLFDTIRNALGGGGKSTSPNLGAGALIAAILGAPFVIWGTVLKHQTLRYTKEGHITDRISKAVEQLGAEKVVERIGRPVTIYTGEPERISYPQEMAAQLGERPRTKLSPKDWEQHWNDEAGDVEEGYYQTVSAWPAERTVIQWEGEEVQLEKNEAIGIEGPWQVFKETAPNIEVRLGALLSLERISQDSVAYDKGRDHVRVMEILCAYIRNNAPASSAKKVPGKDPEALPEDPTDEQIKAHLFDWQLRRTDLMDWAWNLDAPREDVQLALSIIGRRAPQQRLAEACWGAEASTDAEWVFDLPCPEVPQPESISTQQWDQWGKKLKQWQEKLGTYRGYRLDLQNANLQAADLRGSNLSGALLDGAHLNGTELSDAHLVRASLVGANMRSAKFRDAKLQSANFLAARATGANFFGAEMQGTNLMHANCRGALFRDTNFMGSDFMFTSLAGADFLNSRTELLELSYLSLLAADNLSQAQLDKTRNGEKVTLPTDLTRPAHWDA